MSEEDSIGWEWMKNRTPAEPVAKEPLCDKEVGCKKCNWTGPLGAFYEHTCADGLITSTESPTPAAQPTGELTIILRNCPFCGGKAVYQEILDRDDLNYGGEYIECQSCKATTNLQFSTMDAAAPLLAERWNQRVGEARCDCCDSWVKLPNELCEECKGDDH